MNAPNPNPGERDLEALRRAQRAHEPSMEEILASIRSIIADDREPAAKPAAKASAAPAGPQIVYSKDEFAARVSELPPEPLTPKMVWSAPQPEAAPSPAKLETPPASPAKFDAPPASPAKFDAPPPSSARREAAARPPGPAQPEPAREAPAIEAGALLSPQADEAIAAAFESLSASLALQSAELAESMTREILRPMLKAWLDENLPAMVEKLVRAEIQRVARGGR